MIDVSNVAGTREPDGGSGYGLVGMRERAAAAGGRVTAGPGAEGRFDVHAELPVSREMPS
jgi:signal transduction histidine kinase